MRKYGHDIEAVSLRALRFDTPKYRLTARQLKARRLAIVQSRRAWFTFAT